MKKLFSVSLFFKSSMTAQTLKKQIHCVVISQIKSQPIKSNFNHVVFGLKVFLQIKQKDVFPLI